MDESEFLLWCAIGGFLFVIIVLLVGDRLLSHYIIWREKRAFRLRDKRDARLRREALREAQLNQRTAEPQERL